MDRKLINSIAAAWQEVVEKKHKEALDPVDDKANDKKFKNRKDKDIDNDGDVDSSDEFLHKRRKAIDNRKDGGEKPAEVDETLGRIAGLEKKAVAIAKKMGGNMTGAVNEIEKLRKGLSKSPAVKKALRLANEETIDESDEIMAKDGMKKCAECGGSTENHDKECSKYEPVETDEACGKKHMKNETVSHQQWGYGEVLEKNDDGYNVYFEHGVEFNVPAEQLVQLESKDAIANKKTKPDGKGQPADDEDDNLKGKAAQDMAKNLDADDPKLVKDDEEGHDDASKAGRVTKLSKLLPGDKRIGDTKIINPVKK